MFQASHFLATYVYPKHDIVLIYVQCSFVFQVEYTLRPKVSWYFAFLRSVSKILYIFRNVNTIMVKFIHTDERFERKGASKKPILDTIYNSELQVGARIAQWYSAGLRAG
jgi:hypothetical protein